MSLVISRGPDAEIRNIMSHRYDGVRKAIMPALVKSQKELFDIVQRDFQGKTFDDVKAAMWDDIKNESHNVYDPVNGGEFAHNVRQAIREVYKVAILAALKPHMMVRKAPRRK